MDTSYFIPIGVTINNNRQETVDLELSDQNPHGILSGMTGSGKSELILSIITSISTRYSPDDVNFAIIDFKSGSTSDLVSEFPHCAGIASDLDDSSSIIRTIHLLKAESSRRQKMLTNAVKTGIISKAEASEYRNAREKSKGLPPLPLLLIIVDEYGELKRQYDKFDSELASIAKQGRSRFMYLLLADNESKTFHNVRSNISYRICLGFSDITEVQAVLNTSIKSDDKVFLQLTHPNKEGNMPRGRGILNHNGKLIAFQSPYVRAHAPKYKSQLEAYLNCAKQKYTMKGITAYCVLPKQLPEHYLGNASIFQTGFDYRTGKYSMSVNWNIPIGLFDDIINNKRSVYSINPIMNNIVIIGNKGCGKTFTVKSMLFNIITNISPRLCNIVVLNFGDSSKFDEFKDMPHISDVLDLGIGAKKESKERLERLLSVLQRIIETHSDNLLGHNVEFIIFIDGYKFFSDTYPKVEYKLRNMITEGKAAGISFIITCNKIRYISDNVRNVLQQRILMRNTDDEFGFVFTGKCEKKASILCPGRGIIEDEDGNYFDMQISYPACISSKLYMVAINDYKRQYYAENTYRANRIPYMPDVLLFEQVRENNTFNESVIYFGLEMTKLKPVYIPVHDIDCILIEGTVQSGKSFIVDLIIKQLKDYKDWCTMVILDNEKEQHYSPNKPNIEYVGIQDAFSFMTSISNYSTDNGRETVFIIDDIHLLYEKVKATSKQTYDNFYHWIKMQRKQNEHIHFVITIAAEVNEYEILPQFMFNEVVLLGNKLMTTRYPAPVSLKNTAVNTSLEKYHAWISFQDSLSCTKIINQF